MKVGLYVAGKSRHSLVRYLKTRGRWAGELKPCSTCRTTLSFSKDVDSSGHQLSCYKRASPRKGTQPMLEPLDIFIKMEDGTYVWKAAADSFELAKSTVQRLATAAPGEYMIFNQTTGNKIMVKDGVPEPGATY